MTNDADIYPNVDVLNFTVYHSNPYQKLLNCRISPHYHFRKGDIEDSLKQLREAGRCIQHIHWEESLFSGCSSEPEARQRMQEFCARLREFVLHGGKVVWTVHNLVPHEMPYIECFTKLRKNLGTLAHRILVHDNHSGDLIRRQADISSVTDKLIVLPHPAYFGVYEPEQKTRDMACKSPELPRTLLHFGMVRAYKQLPVLLNLLSPEFMWRNRLRLNIVGKPHRADGFFRQLRDTCLKRAELGCQFRHVRNADVGSLFRSHAGVIISSNGLTSGVAVLALTFGIPVIAPDTPTMRELYPLDCHFLLYRMNSANDLQAAILRLMQLPPESRARVSASYMEQALRFHPAAVSLRLRGIYDELCG